MMTRSLSDRSATPELEDDNDGQNMDYIDEGISGMSLVLEDGMTQPPAVAGQTNPFPTPSATPGTKCQYCAKNFTRNHDLRRHLATSLTCAPQESIQPKRCDCCGKLGLWTRDESFRRHQKRCRQKHNGNAPVSGSSTVNFVHHPRSTSSLGDQDVVDDSIDSPDSNMLSQSTTGDNIATSSSELQGPDALDILARVAASASPANCSLSPAIWTLSGEVTSQHRHRKTKSAESNIHEPHTVRELERSQSFQNGMDGEMNRVEYGRADMDMDMDDVVSDGEDDHGGGDTEFDDEGEEEEEIDSYAPRSKSLTSLSHLARSSPKKRPSTSIARPTKSLGFVCQICGRAFGRSHDLIRHQSHSACAGGEKKGLTCEVCGESGRNGYRKDALKRHMRLRHGL